MESIALFALSLTVYLASAFNVRELGNYNLQQNLSMPVSQQNEAEFFSRIIGGETARRNQFKYQVGLRGRYADGDFAPCGGSIISHKWVLTAAHCLHNCIRIDVYLGTLILDQARTVFYRVPRRDMIEHDEYNYDTDEHDIGLVKIPQIEFSESVNRVDLPGNNELEYNGLHAYLTGWGQTSDSSKDFSTKLLYARFKIITNEECAAFYGSPKIYKGKICTETSKRISGCIGDSGGPLVLVEEKIQIGIYSFGYGLACEEGLPDAYTRVSHYLDWIRLHTNSAV